MQAALVERLLRGSVEQEQSSGDRTNFGFSVEERMNSSGNAGPAVTYASNVTQQHSFWAKGTGFGSGTTQQQWNVDLHVLKRKQDEQNVTLLLKVYFVSSVNGCISAFLIRLFIWILFLFFF